MRCVGFDELLCDILRAVGGAIVDNDEFPVQFSVWCRRKRRLAGLMEHGQDCKRGQHRRFAGQNVLSQKMKGALAYSWVKVRLSNQVMMGKFWRSLNVGRITE